MALTVQDSLSPTNKVVASGVAGAIVTITVWATKVWGKTDIPIEIALALNTIVMVVAGYLMPPSDRDSVTIPKEP